MRTTGLRVAWSIVLSVMAAMLIAGCDDDCPTCQQCEDCEECPPSDPGPDFVRIPAGTFTMGSPLGELGRQSGETQHQVTLTKAFYMSKYEVTEELWDSVLGNGISTSQRPRGGVSWFEALQFCNAMSIRDGRTPAYVGSGTNWTWNSAASGYRLPTEAEWEYACRAGTGTATANGAVTVTGCAFDAVLTGLAWYCNNSASASHDVAMKQANPWGLHDMHGNILEWCWDWYGAYSSQSATDPNGPSTGTIRIMRGGCWRDVTEFVRAAHRHTIPPADVEDFFGVRLVVSAE